MKRLLHRLLAFRHRARAKPSPVVPVMPPRSVLDELPVELKVLLLKFMPDTLTLYALIRSSSSYHNAYLSDREHILRSVLQREMSPEILVEALATRKASRIARDQNWHSNLQSFLKDYKADRTLVSDSNTIQRDDILAVATLHSAVHAVTSKYCKFSLSVHPVTNQPTQAYEPPSENEAHRIHRALYRFETFCALFADEDVRPSYRPRGFNSRNMARMFLLMFEPWEGEEIACVLHCLFRCYSRCLGYCGDELYEMDLSKEREDLRFLGRDESQASEHVQERSEPYYSNQIEVFMKLGLPFFLKLARQYGPERQWEVIKEHIIPEYDEVGHFLSKALREAPYSSRHHNFQAFYEPFPHPPDRYDSVISDTDGPNAAWMWHINGKQAGSYSPYTLNNHRLWGYVLWDYERLDRWGILDMNPHFRDDKEGWRAPRKTWVFSETTEPSGRVLPKWELVEESRDLKVTQTSNTVTKKGWRCRWWVWFRGWHRWNRWNGRRGSKSTKPAKTPRSQLRWSIIDR